MVKRLNLHLHNWGSLKRDGGGHHFPQNWQYSPIFARAIPWMFQGMHKVVQRCQTDSQILSCHRQDAACCSVTVDSSQKPRRSQMSSDVWQREICWGHREGGYSDQCLHSNGTKQMGDDGSICMHWSFDTSLILLYGASIHTFAPFFGAMSKVVVGHCSLRQRSWKLHQKVQSCPAQFRFEELRDNRELVLGALQENGLMLEHATQDLRGDGMHWPWHLCKILPMWQRLTEFRLVASIDVSLECFEWWRLERNAKAFSTTHGVLRIFGLCYLEGDSQIALVAVTSNPSALQFPRCTLAQIQRNLLFHPVPCSFHFADLPEVCCTETSKYQEDCSCSSFQGAAGSLHFACSVLCEMLCCYASPRTARMALPYGLPPAPWRHCLKCFIKKWYESSDLWSPHQLKRLTVKW